jgi:uncharacterized protein YkwD
MAVNTPNPTLVSQTPQQMQISSPSSTMTTMTTDESRFLELTNNERVARGLQPLTYDPNLTEIARAHSREMSDKNYFSHHSPTPGIETPMDRYLSSVKQRPSWALVGENLFYCSIEDVDRGHQALMKSPTHRDNILESRFERMGVGIYINPEGEFFVTEMFLAETD